MIVKLSDLTTALGKRDGCETRLILLVKVLVDVESIKGGIEGTECRTEAKAMFGISHQRVKVSDIGLIEGEREFCQDELAPAGNFGSDDAGSVTPIVLADRDIGGRGVALWGRWSFFGRCALVTSPFAAETAVRITSGPFFFVVTITEEGFLVVFLDPGEDMLGIEGNRTAKVVHFGAKFSLDLLDSAIKQELEGDVGHGAHKTTQMAMGGQTGIDVKAPRKPMR